MAAIGRFKQFYDSKAWKACRKYYIAKRRNVDGGMCEICQGRVGIELDHIEELDENNLDDPMVTLNHDNLQFLCRECHNKKTSNKDKRIIVFDEEGHPIIKDYS